MRYAAGALLTIHTSKVVLHHRDNKPNIAAPNLWGFFGGTGEVGEEPLDTVVRELHEELEVTLIRDRLTLLKEYKNLETGNIVYIFHYPVTDELSTARLHEGQDWGIFGPDDIDNLNMIPTHRAILEEFWRSNL